MEVVFEYEDKSVKKQFIDGIQEINQIIKNIYDTPLINNKGQWFNMNSNLKNGYCLCKAESVLDTIIKDGQLLEFYTRVWYDTVKAGKTKITGYKNDGYELTLLTTEGDFVVGKFHDNKELNLTKIKDARKGTPEVFDADFLIDMIAEKKFMQISLGENDKIQLLITHKLFPGINKATHIEIEIYDYDINSYCACFHSYVEKKNKKGETTFKMEMQYYYRFLKL